MVFYGAQFAPISLSVTWHPDPGEQCTRPAFDVVDRMVRDPSGRERPSSSYLMSLHPQGLAARAGLGAFGLTLEELRRRVPERQAATIPAALLQQVAPYAHACR
jgi:hypothetical protein